MNTDNPLRRARRYLQRRGDHGRRALETGDTSGVRQVVVIPALAEFDWLFQTLESLARNDPDEVRSTLVICVVNNRAEPFSTSSQVADNRRTLRRLRAMIRGDFSAAEAGGGLPGLRLAAVDASSSGSELDPSVGVGEARRIGLDHALDVLCDNVRPHGPLLNLDADTLVAPDYLSRVREHFENGGAWGAVVGYEHRLPDDSDLSRAIVTYELYLRYHELGLRRAGSPYAFPTIGSTMVARADAYVAVGGMNRRQAAEDFYFLQQLFKTGGVSRIDTTSVYPSARRSDRVPFGTGASIERWVAGHRDAERVYNPEIYAIIGAWLSVVRAGLDSDASALLREAAAIDPYLNRFLLTNSFERTWPRLQKNAPDRFTLEAQFHRWFDAFKTLKLIHYLRDQVLPGIPLFEACREILVQRRCDVEGIDWAAASADLDGRIRLLRVMRGMCAS